MRKKNWSNCTTLAGAKLGVPALEPGQGTKGKSWVKFEQEWSRVTRVIIFHKKVPVFD